MQLEPSAGVGHPEQVHQVKGPHEITDSQIKITRIQGGAANIWTVLTGYPETAEPTIKKRSQERSSSPESKGLPRISGLP